MYYYFRILKLRTFIAFPLGGPGSVSAQYLLVFVVNSVAAVTIFPQIVSVFPY
jgi:hypothetical protein